MKGHGPVIYRDVNLFFLQAPTDGARSGCAQLAVKGLLGGGRPLISGFY